MLCRYNENTSYTIPHCHIAFLSDEFPLKSYSLHHHIDSLSEPRIIQIYVKLFHRE